MMLDCVWGKAGQEEMLIRAGAVSVSVSGPRVEDTRTSPFTSPDSASRPINTSTFGEASREIKLEKMAIFNNFSGGDQKSHSSLFKNSEESRNAPREPRS